MTAVYFFAFFGVVFIRKILWHEWREYVRKLDADFDRDFGRCERIFTNPITTHRWQRK